MNQNECSGDLAYSVGSCSLNLPSIQVVCSSGSACPDAAPDRQPTAGWLVVAMNHTVESLTSLEQLIKMEEDSPQRGRVPTPIFLAQLAQAARDAFLWYI